MAVFISVSTDPFEEVFEGAQMRQPQVNVRRPLRGIEIKEDTYAVIRVLTATGEEIKIYDSSSDDVENGIGRSSHYANFIIQQLSEARMEKQQIVETFGDDYVFFFGERPRFLQVQGVLLNTNDFNWKSEFWSNYEKYLRGTRLVEQNARMYLYFDDVVVEGYIVQASTAHQSEAPYHLPFNFQMFVTNYAILSSVGRVFFQDRSLDAQASGGLLPPDPELQAEAASRAARAGAGGGLNSFLAASVTFSTNATFSIQATLENIKNTFYGRRLVIPEGLGSSLYLPPIENNARFEPAPINRPIHEMSDEYVEQAPMDPQFDESARAEMFGSLYFRRPEELEKRARLELARLGVDVSRPSTNYLLLGRAAFAGLQVFGSFGIRQADGVLNLI